MISKERYVSALRQLNPESLEHKAVAALFTLPECRGTAPLVAAQAGWPSYSVANLAFGNAARRVAEFLGEIPPERATDDPGWWSILADGVRNERGFWWTLRPAVVAALRDLEWSTAEACANLQGGEMPHEKFQEGAMVRVCVSSYERNRAARLECIRVSVR